MPKTEKQSRLQLPWKTSDGEWETTLKKARVSIQDFIRDACASGEDREQPHRHICTAVEIYVRSLIRVTKRKAPGKDSYRREFIGKPLGAAEPLRRLLTSHTAHAQARAWTELPAVAMDALADAAYQLKGTPLHEMMNRWPTLPGTFVQFDPVEIAVLVPVAIQIARNYGNRNSVRDRMVMELLAQFPKLYGHFPSEKEADRFLSAIEACYSQLLPEYGFNIRSPGTIYRALSHARSQALQ